MSPADTLRELRLYGADLILSGDSVRLRMPTGVAVGQALVSRAKRQKADLRSLLEEEARDAFCERAAIVEFDGGLPRAHAEVLAALCQVAPPDVLAAAARLLERQLARATTTRFE